MSTAAGLSSPPELSVDANHGCPDSETGRLMGPKTGCMHQNSTKCRAAMYGDFEEAPQGRAGFSGWQEQQPLPPGSLPPADPEGMDALNTTAVLACLKGRPGFATFSVCSAALIVIWLQIFTLLNLSWLLNDARMADMEDYDDNYVLIPHEDLKNDSVKVLETAHKHIGGQSDRFCYDTTSGTDRVNFYYTYYNCIYTNTMTYWDLVTILLLTIALADKVGEAHQELNLEMVLASAALHGPGVSILRRALTLGFLGWRCLLEALFLVVSIVIVAASKGTVEMVLNSLAISFFADLDNIAWKRLISTAPAVKAMQRELIDSVAKTHAAALGAIEERKLQTILFTGATLIIYVVGTISYKNPKLFKWLWDRGAYGDSNIGVAILLIPSIAVWTTMSVHFGSISNHAIKLQAKMESEVPGSSTIVVGHVVTISLCLLFLTIGIQEAGAGAQCAWRVNMISALILSVPLMAMHALVQLRLRQPRSKAARAVLSTASAVLAAVAIGLAFRNSFSATLDPLSNAVMSGTTTCACGYGGWWATPEDFCWEQCHIRIDGICDPAVENPDFDMPRALWCPNLAEDQDDPQVCLAEVGTEG